MKKITKVLSLCLLATLLLASLTSCDMAGSVKAAYEKEGYTITTVKTDNAEAKALFTLAGYSEEEIEELSQYELILCTKGFSSALVIKFPSSGALKSFLTDGEDTSAYDKAKDEKQIRGNCLLVYGNEEIFQK